MIYAINMFKAFTFSIVLFLFSGLVFGQNFVGPTGGISYTSVSFSNFEGIRQGGYGLSAFKGISYKYLPKKELGVVIQAHLSELSFTERLSDSLSYHYKYKEASLQFMSHLFIDIGRVRPYLEAGPAISWYQSPSAPDSVANSVLPEFVDYNLNKVLLGIAGGPGVTISFGVAELSVYGRYVMTLSNLYRHVDGRSQPFALQGGATLHVRIGKKREPE